tara:strand:+ start:12424 stop:14565 length:2142 start_codon:yes stop_codon:yes gene_type:complete
MITITDNNSPKRTIQINGSDSPANKIAIAGLVAAGALTIQAESRARRVRNAANAARLVASMEDGDFDFLGNEIYQKDSTATGSASCTEDLGVDGLIPGGAITPYHFGWSTSKTASQATDIINKALAYAGTLSAYTSPTPAEANDHNGATVYLTHRRYTVNGTLNMNRPGVGLVGSGSGNSQIRMASDDLLLDVMDPDAATGQEIYGNRIANIDLRGNFTNPTQSIALRLSLTRQCQVENVQFRGFFGDIQSRGCLAFTEVKDCNFFAGTAVSTSTGDGGGWNAHITAMETNEDGSTFGIEDPDRPGIYYAHTAGIRFTGCHFRNGKDAKATVFWVQACDGLWVNSSKATSANSEFIKFDPLASNVPVANNFFYDFFFDGEASSTDYCVRTLPRSYATPSTLPREMSIINAKWNGCGAGAAASPGARHLLAENEEMTLLEIQGGFVNKCFGTDWFEIKAGHPDGICRIGGLIMEMRDGEGTSGNGIDSYVKVNGTSQATMFGKVNVEGLDLTKTGSNVSLHNVRITGEVNEVIIGNIGYDISANTSGDGLVYADHTLGTVSGGALQRGSMPYGLKTKGSYTLEMTDQSGTPSATTATAEWVLNGNIVSVYSVNITNISSAAPTASDDIRVTLPFKTFANGRSLSPINIRQMATLTGAGTNLVARTAAAARYANIVNLNPTGVDAVQKWSNISSGATDIQDFQLSYRVDPRAVLS